MTYDLIQKHFQSPISSADGPCVRKMASVFPKWVFKEWGNLYQAAKNFELFLKVKISYCKTYSG
jgi:hypothetical protein